MRRRFLIWREWNSKGECSRVDLYIPSPEPTSGYNAIWESVTLTNRQCLMKVSSFSLTGGSKLSSEQNNFSNISICYQRATFYAKFCTFFKISHYKYYDDAAIPSRFSEGTPSKIE